MAIENLFIDDIKEECSFLTEYYTPNLSPSEARLYIGYVDYDPWYSDPYIAYYSAFQEDQSIRAVRAEGKQRFCLYLDFHDKIGGKGYITKDTEATENIYAANFNVYWLYEEDGDLGLISDGQNVDWVTDDRSATFSGADADSTDINSFNWRVGSSGSSVQNRLSLYVGGRRAKQIYFHTNIPVFVSMADATRYINTGDDTGCVNKEGESQFVPATAGKRYYYNMALYKTPDGDYANATLIAKRSWECYSKGIVTGYCSKPAPYNVAFLVGGSYLSTKFTENGVTTTGLMLEQINAKKWSYVDANNLLFDGEYYYYTNVTTNITMRNTKEEAKAVSRKEEPEDHVTSTHRNRTGTDLDYQQNTDRNFRSAMCSVWKTSYQGTNHIADALYSVNDQVIDDIKEGLKMMGTNPIDCVCAMWHSPIALGEFCVVDTQRMKIGNYVIPDWEFDRCSGQKYKELCSVYIAETFGNFLDYTNMALSLYLPFIGIFEIDTAEFLNKVMRITVGIDLFNATMKYWIYADEKLVLDKSCNFGCQMAVTGNDQVGRAREAIQSVNQVQNDILGTIAAAAVNPAAGGLAATKVLTNAALATTPAAMGFTNKGKMMSSGTTSAGVSCGDILYPFLIIDVQDAIIPPDLYDVYGMPCNLVTTLNKCKGWTECYDVQLKGGMLPEEKEEIINKLSSGVIL